MTLTNIVLTAAQFAGFSAINLGNGNDIITVNISGTVDISASGNPTISNVETINITGSASADSITLTGTQLNRLLSASSDSINLGDGSDIINLTSTSTSLNDLTNAELTNVEAVSASGATAAVTINLSNQSEAFTITGGTGDDTITGGAGNDSITGGNGTDTVVYSGNRVDYTISLNSSTYTVGDNRASSPNGTDTVTTVENFQFADGTFTTAQLDLTAPTVSSVAYGTNDGTLKAGETVTLVVNFSEAVNIAGGTPSLTLNSGGTATYTSGSGTTALTFIYTVAAGQTAADLAVTALNLNTATLKDAQGNNAVLTGAVANPTGTLVVDTIAPTAPTIGEIAIDNIINTTEATAGVTFSGTAEAGSTVNVTIGSVTKTVTATGGNWSTSLTSTEVTTIGQGSKTASVTATDAAGNVSTAATRTFSIDTIAPTAPTIGAIAMDNRINATEATADITISGTAEVGTTVDVKIGSVTKQVTATPEGTWSTTLTPTDITTLGQGDKTVSVTATDAAGNVTTLPNQTLAIDTVAPSAPAITAVIDDVGSITGDVANSGQTNDSAPSFNIDLTGTNAVIGDVVKLFNGAIEIASHTLTSTDISGNSVSITPTSVLAEGSHSITATITDADGNQSTASAARTFQIDTTDPAAIALTSTSIAENNASNAIVTAISATDANSITYSLVSGDGDRDNAAFAIVGDQLQIINPANFEVQHSYSIRIRATDAAGNVTETARTISVTDVNEFSISDIADNNSAAADRVAENATNGTVVGITAFASDADGTTNTVTYSLSDDAGGRFAIDATGVVTVANGSLLNYEDATSHKITVVATSADNSTSSKEFTIALTNANDNPVVGPSDSNNAVNTVAENAAIGTAVGIIALRINVRTYLNDGINKIKNTVNHNVLT